MKPPSASVIAELWRVGSQSWVSPQIAATLSLADPEFGRHAIEQLLAVTGVPQKPPPRPPVHLTTEELSKVDAAFEAALNDPERRAALQKQARRHSAEGPGWGLAPLAKWIDALMGLAEVDAELRSRRDLVRLHEYAESGDWGEFARAWRSKALEALAA